MKNRFEQIEKFLDGELEGEELTQFEQQLNTNMNLIEDKTLIEKLRNSVSLYLRSKKEQEELESTLEKLGNKYFWDKNHTLDSRKNGQSQKKKTTKVFMLPQKLVSLAASFVIILILGSGFYASFNYSDQAIVNDFYENISGLKSGNAYEKDALFDQGVEFFNYKKFKEAISAFEEIAPEQPAYLEAQYYLAHSYTKIGAFQEAIDKFGLLIESDNLPSRINPNELKWNRLVAIVGNGGQPAKEFERAMDEMLSPESPYREKASMLDKRLGNFWRKLAI